jgi:hypothetical protein
LEAAWVVEEGGNFAWGEAAGVAHCAAEGVAVDTEFRAGWGFPELI